MSHDMLEALRLRSDTYSHWAVGEIERMRQQLTDEATGREAMKEGVAIRIAGLEAEIRRLRRAI